MPTREPFNTAYSPILFRDWDMGVIHEVADTTVTYTVDGLFAHFGHKCRYILARNLSTGKYVLIDLSECKHEVLTSGIVSSFNKSLGTHYVFSSYPEAMTSLIALSLGE